MEFVSEEDKNDMKNETFSNAYPTEDEEVDMERDLEDWVEEEEKIKSLFNDDRLESVEQLVAHDREMFGFDLKSIVSQNCSDDIEVIKLINFIRSKVSTQETDTISPEFISGLVETICSKDFIQNDAFMKPFIEDDPLLYLYEEELLPNAQDSD